VFVLTVTMTTTVDEKALASSSPPLDRPCDRAYALGRELQTLAAAQASMDHDFCVLVDRFDDTGAVAYFDGIRSTAHYLAWACAMNGTVAREHVRVARALRDLPLTSDLFRQGRLSYSKVRELTRLAGTVDEAELIALALELTASQLARTVSAYRLASGSRIRALGERRYRSQPSGDGMVRISVVLPAEQAALVTAAVDAAAWAATVDDVDAESDIIGDQPRAVRAPDRVQALVDVAAHYLDTLPATPADDHTLVMVHVDADALGVPAGTSVDSGTCFVEGQGAVEPATVERLMCTAKVQGVLVSRGRKVLNLGRTRRLATRGQRRALRVRDKGICQFPGCPATAHLDAHHVVPWSHGGPSDLDNLILLCGRHHTLVHEGGLRIRPASAPASRHWAFWMPDGRRVDADGYHAWRNVDALTQVLALQAEAAARAEPTRIFPPHAGAGFSLHECVRVLFDIALPDLEEAA
jgi:hypothetical protein